MSALSGEQIIRLAETLPSLLTAGAALSAAVTSLLVALHARRAADHAQETAESATEQAREAAKEQIRFALRNVVHRADAPAGAGATFPIDITPPEEGGDHE
jgi:hypothetical protein